MAHNGLIQKISLPPPPPPPWTTLNWVPTNCRISKKDNCSFCRIPELLIQHLEEFQNFTKILMVFLEFRLKFAKYLGKFVNFQSYSLSISYRISNVVHGGVWILFGTAQNYRIKGGGGVLPPPPPPNHQ